jgi:4-amino-4-deoxy-L-arabinose transferase-like glycosyltransferase
MASLTAQQDRSSGGPDAGSATGGRPEGWFARLAPWLLIGGLVVFHAVNNWLWLDKNVTLTGWDRPRHLAQSITYARMLSPITLRSLFDVMVWDSIRPPLFPASASILYWLFGWSSDVATMVNVIYMAILLAATYGIGKRWGGRWLGMASVALLACFPMFYAMSRYFYLEFGLTALVALSVFLLLATDCFQRRGLSLLFGLSLGLGLLTKRTFAVFVVGPVIVAILASGLLPAFWQRLRQRPHLYWKKALLALLGGLALAALWYFPNRETVRALILGDALFFIWWALAALAIYFVALPSAPLSNALSAFFLGATLASTWYLARVEFVQRMALYGYGVNDPRGRALQLDSLTTYLYYVRKLGNEHLSLGLFSILVAVLLVAAVVYLRRQGSLGRALRGIRVEGWVVLAWIGGAYMLLTFSIYQETRAFTPVLPAVALIFGAALSTLPWRRVRLGLLALVLVLGVLQFFVLSFASVNRWLPIRSFSLPLWGETTLLAQGAYLELPDEGPTDRGYWIQPDILERMENRRQALGQESLSMGLLARTRQINAGAFIYLTLADYPYLRMESLVEGFDPALPRQRIYAHDYVAVKRQNVGMDPAQEQIVQGFLDGTSQLFAEAFELETSYRLPDGDTVYLYRQRYYLPGDYTVEYVTRLAEDLGSRAQARDAILLTPPELLGPFVSHYTGPAEVYVVPAEEEDLAGIADRHRRLFLVVGDAAAGDPQDWAQGWLNQHGFRATHEWADSLQLLTYGTAPHQLATIPTIDLHATMGDQIELVGYDLWARSWWHPGELIPLTLFWQRQGAVQEDYNVFVHLLDKSSQLAAQTDSAPAGGSRPTSTWQENEIIVDRHGLLLPDHLPPGEYELRVGMYLRATGERLPVQGPDLQALGDSISLGQIKMASP